MLSHLVSGFNLLIVIPVFLSFVVGFLTFGITKEDREDLENNKAQLPSVPPKGETSTQKATT